MVSRVRALGVCVIGLVGLGLVLSAQSEPPDAAQTARSAYYHTRARLADDEAAFREVGSLILDVLEGLRGGTTDEAVIRQRVGALTDAFPVGKPRRD